MNLLAGSFLKGLSKDMIFTMIECQEEIMSEDFKNLKEDRQVMRENLSTILIEILRDLDEIITKDK